VHHFAFAEVAPLLPALPAAGEGLAALFPLLLWGLALALLIIWRHTIGALLEHLARMFNAVSIPTPFGHVRPLGFVAAGLQAADYAVQQALSVSARATERAAVYLFHKSIASFESVGRELYRLAEDTGYAFLHFTHHTIPRLLRAGLHRVEHDVALNLRFLHKIEHALVRPLMGRVHRLEATLEHDFGIARRGIDVTKRDLTRAEKATERLAGRVHALEKRLGVGVFAGAVAVALGTLGLGFLRCPSFLRMGRRLGCGSFAFLEELLFSAGAVFALSDLCRFTGLVTVSAVAIRPALLDFVDVEEALIHCHGATQPDALSIPSLRLPPSNAGMQLAA
jgi:hypothetical protein